MRPFARVAGVLTLAAALSGTAVGALPLTADAVSAPEAGRQFSVLGVAGVPVGDLIAAVTAAGGQVEGSNAAIGLVTARAGGEGFTARAARSAGVQLVAPVTVVGRVPTLLPGVVPDLRDAERGARTDASATPYAAGKVTTAARPVGPPGDPLDVHLWGLTAINAGAARQKEPGDKRVLVGVIDTGVDGTHPDIAPNFDGRLSRNFVTDIPKDTLGQVLDGPCEVATCKDPADVDDNGHGTHVAGTIAAAMNGFGISGVAPGVRIVNLRAAQDSGLFFLQSVVDAITYAGDVGVDVVNMSFYTDPWAANCAANPADSAAQQAEQQVILEGMTRAMAYADGKGVTQLVALGNGSQDPEALHVDSSSPDYPANTAHPRLVDASCKDLPAADPHAIRVSAYGPSGGKSGYSNYGPSTSVSAPGGWFGDYAGTAEGNSPANGILSAYPRALAITNGDVDKADNVTAQGDEASVQQTCRKKVCAYYHYFQGTSMATPHATGVAALIVSAYGSGRGRNFGLDPAAVRRILEGTAAGMFCPEPLTALFTYGATCTGDTTFNTFYGHGSVDALAAVTEGRALLAAARENG